MPSGETSWAGAGGAGGKGRVAVYYGKSLSGSLSSTYYGTYTTGQDDDLIPSASGAWFMFM